MEFGYVARYAKKLPQSVNFGQAPYFFKYPASGQTFAQAFDAVTKELRGGTAASSVTVQPFFENSFPALGTTTGGTRALAAAQSTNFVNGNLNPIFQTMDVRRMQTGRTPFNNYISQMLFLRTSIGESNYNAGFVTLRKRLTNGFLYTVNYTFSKSLDQFGNIQNSASEMPNSFDLNVEYGPSPFDITHQFNTSYLYELPFGKGKKFGTSRAWLDKVVGGWYTSGIYTARSGDPLTVNQGAGGWGGSLFLGFTSGAIPTVDPLSLSNSVTSGVAGSNGIGTNGDPANRGTGLNMFSNPEQVLKSFRRVEVATGGRAGRANPLRGLPRWNMDMSIGKRTHIGGEHGANITFAADFFNLTNHVDFANPSLDLTN